MAARVSISVVGRPYEINCDDGQEDAVKALAADVDRRTSELLRAVGQVGDAKLLVMVALLMAEEIQDLRRRVGEGEHPGDASLAQGIDLLSRRIESIADRMGTP